MSTCRIFTACDNNSYGVGCKESSNFLVFLQHVTISRMVWTVENHVVTVATGNRFIMLTEVVNLDVTFECLFLNVIQVLL